MNLSGQAKQLKIIVGESDKVYQRPLYEAIVYAAKKYKIAGATVFRGMFSYGADSIIHRSKIFALSEDVPVVIVLVDVNERLVDFSVIINRLMDKSGAGGLMAIEDVEVLRYGSYHD